MIGAAIVAENVVVERTEVDAPLRLLLVASDGTRMVAELTDAAGRDISFALTRRLRAVNISRLEALAAGHSGWVASAVTVPPHSHVVRL